MAKHLCEGCDYYYKDEAFEDGYFSRPYCHYDDGCVHWYSDDYATFGEFLDEVGINYIVDENGGYIVL